MKRLDVAAVERGLCSSREQSQASDYAGQVTVNQQPARKPSDLSTPPILSPCKPTKNMSAAAAISWNMRYPFPFGRSGSDRSRLGSVHRRVHRLPAAHGAARVYAVDVGHGQLAWTLRRDARVVVMDRVNARNLTPASLPPPFVAADLVVIDLRIYLLAQNPSPHHCFAPAGW